MKKTTENDFPVVALPKEVVLHPNLTDELLDRYLFPHRFEPGCFIIALNGQCKISINLMEYKVNAKSVVTVLPRSIVSVISRSEDFDCCLLAFPPEFIKDMELLRTILSRAIAIEKAPVLRLDEDETVFIEELLDTFVKIYNKAHLKGELGFGVIKNILMSFFYGVCAIYDKKSPMISNIHITRKEEITKEFLSLVFKYYSKERSVSYYADLMCITPKYLNTVVREVKGISASQIIANAVIMEAKSRLKSSTDTVQQIAISLNFPNQSFFTKYFKRNTGMTPSEYAVH